MRCDVIRRERIESHECIDGVNEGCSVHWRGRRMKKSGR